MKFLSILGVILIILGIVALILQGITLVTGETIVDFGPLQISRERERTIPLPPLLGLALLAAGVVLVIAGARKT